MGGNIGAVQSARAVYINNSYELFHLNKLKIQAQWEANPNLFKKQDWRSEECYESSGKEKVKLAESFYQFHEKYAMGFPWNKKQHLCWVVPMIHGTKPEILDEVTKAGFGLVFQKNLGYYGQGIYTTSKFDYARIYGTSFIICMTLPGNIFPILEPPFLDAEKMIPNPKGYYAKPCKPGYQSHYTCVPIASGPSPLETEPTEKTADELAIYESGHLLPLFLITI